jgi:hypothetical protein
MNKLPDDEPKVATAASLTKQESNASNNSIASNTSTVLIHNNNNDQVSLKPIIKSNTSTVPANRLVDLLIKLSASTEYKIIMLYCDENLVENHFYVTPINDLEKYVQLDEILQEETALNNEKFTYVENLDQLNLNDKLEARFDQDDRWYRVCVRNLDLKKQDTTIYFVDYGNSQVITQDTLTKTKPLRFRNFYDKKEEKELFNMNFQAIRCCYLRSNESRAESMQFVNEQLGKIEIPDQGIRIRVNKIINNDFESDRFELTSKTYGISFMNEIVSDESQSQIDFPTTPASSIIQSDNDLEVKEILEKASSSNTLTPSPVPPPSGETVVQPEVDAKTAYPENPSLDVGGFYNINVLHIENVSDFYFQIVDDIEESLKLQQTIRELIASLLDYEKKSSDSGQKLNSETNIFQVGDFIFAKYLGDKEWYRAIVLAVDKLDKNNNQNAEQSAYLDTSMSDFEDNINNNNNAKSLSENDDYLYRVYFVDYGNTETGMTSKNLRHLTKNLAIKSLAKKERLDYIEQMSFMAVCCKLNDQIKCTERNNQYLKSLLDDHESFIVKLDAKNARKILKNELEINQYSVSLFSTDNKTLENKFEKETKEIPTNNKSIPSPPPQSPLKIKKQEFKEEVLSMTQFYECIPAFSGENAYFVQLLNKAEQLLRLENELTVYTPPKSTTSAHNKGDLVLAKFVNPIDNQSTWCRAVITNSDHKIEVFYLDYGDYSDSISNSDLVPLPDEFSLDKTPCLAYRIKFDFNVDDVLVAQFFAEEEFQIKVCSISRHKFHDKIELNFYEVEIWDKKKEKCLNEIMNNKNKKKIHKLEDLSLIKLEPGHFYESKIACLEDEIFINLTSDFNYLIKLQEELADFKAVVNTEIKPESYSLGDFVLAKYYQDENEYDYCRALITQISKDNNNYDVFFFDYGNSSKDLTIKDLMPLPEKFDMHNYPPFAFMTYLNNVKLNVEDLEQAKIIADFLELNETFYVKVLRLASPLNIRQNSPLKHCRAYTSEIWDLARKTCLNDLLKTPDQQQQQIQQVNRRKLIQNTPISASKQFPLKIRTNDAYMDSFEKPFYFCMEPYYSKRDELKTKLNQTYASHSSNSIDISEYKLHDYLAVYSEDSWYRAQIKEMILYSTKCLVLLIDYGFEEVIDFKSDAERLRPLNEEFTFDERFSFATFLINPQRNNNEILRIDAKLNEEFSEELNQVIGEFIEDLDLVLHGKLDEFLLSSSGVNYFPNEDYYGVEIRNLKGQCLNEMLLDKQEMIKKKLAIKKPASIQLSLNEIPAQSKDLNQLNHINKKYLIYSYEIAQFYIFNQEIIEKIQDEVKEICARMDTDVLEYVSSTSSKILRKGDLVFSKYDDDAWYRCMVNDFDLQTDHVELFFIDFGNTSVVKSNELIYPCSEDQLSLFKNYAPQAYLCKLYGLEPVSEGMTSYTDAQNTAFKDFYNDKLFDVQFIKYNSNEDIYEICLSEENSFASTHMHLIAKKIGN